MSIPTALEIKEQLHKSVSIFFQEGLAYTDAAQKLASIGVRVRDDILEASNFEKVIDTYFENLQKKITNEYSNGTPATVDINSDLYGTPRKAYHNIFNAEITREEVSHKPFYKILDGIKFERIHSEIVEQVRTIEERGVANLCNKIIDILNIHETYYTPSARPKHIVFFIHRGGRYSSYELNTKFRPLLDAFSKIELAANIEIKAPLIEFLNAASYGHLNNSSRQTFGKGKNLEIVCFKEKFEFRVTYDLFDGISAYINLYAIPQDVNQFNRVTQPLVKVA